MSRRPAVWTAAWTRSNIGTTSGGKVFFDHGCMSRCPHSTIVRLSAWTRYADTAIRIADASRLTLNHRAWLVATLLVTERCISVVIPAITVDAMVRTAPMNRQRNRLLYRLVCLTNSLTT